MLKIQILTYIIAGLKKIVQVLNNAVCSLDALRYGALILEQTHTNRNICLTDIEIRKLGGEKLKLQDKYDYIQQLKAEYIKNN